MESIDFLEKNSNVDDKKNCRTDIVVRKQTKKKIGKKCPTSQFRDVK